MNSISSSWRLNEFTPGFSRTGASEKWLRDYIRELEGVKGGEGVCFGRCPVSTNIKPCEENRFYQDILWRVLEVRGEKLMLLSEYILDWEGFDFEYKPWKQSFLREMLNGEYLNTWFTPMEQKMLCGEPDRVYLLTVDKVRKYFPEPGSAAARMPILDTCKPEKNNGYCFGIEEYPHEWWLCTPGTEEGSTAYVTCRGSIDEEGNDSGAEGFGVRPVIWIDIGRMKELLP